MAGKKESASKTTDRLYLLFWALLPFIHVSSLVDYTLIPRQLFTAGFLLLTTIISWKFLFGSNRLSGSVISFSGFIIITSLASFGAINEVESIASIVRYLISFSFLAITISLLKQGKLTKNGLIRGVVVFASVASVMALFGILKALGDGEFFKDIYTVKANFSHKNILSAVLMLSLPFSVAGAVLFKKGWRMVSFLVTFLMIAEIFVLRTRGIWLSSFISVFIVSIVFFIFRNKQIPGVKYPGKYIGAAVAIALVLMIGLLSVDTVSQKVLNRTNVDRRLEFWENSMEMIKEHPFLGVGAGNWKIHFPKYGLNGLDWSVRQGITHIQRPHNDYLWAWTEGGPLALLFYLGIFIAAFWRIGSNFKNARTKEDFVINMCMTFGILAYMVFSFSDFPIERMEANVLIMSMIALVFAGGKDSGLRISGNITKGLMVIILGFALLVCYHRWQGEKTSALVNQANSQRNARLLVQFSDQAVNSFYNMDNFANPMRYYTSQGYMVQRNQEAAYENALIAYDLHPYNIVVLNQMGNVLKHLGKVDEALTYYSKARDISEIFELSLLSIAEIKVRQQEYFDAFGALLFVQPNVQNGKYVKLMTMTLPHLVNYQGDDPPFPSIMRDMKERTRGKDPSTYLSIYHQYKAEIKQRALEQERAKGRDL